MDKSVGIDIHKVRADTPGVESVIHFNNAGAALPPSLVLDTVVEYLQTEAMIGGYEVAADRADELDSVYSAACSLLGGAPANWAFVESATRAWNAAFSALRFEPGDKVVTTRAEYPSNMGGLLRAREIQGVEVLIAPDDEYGQVDVAALTAMLDERTRLVSVTHVPTQGGLINPVEQLGAVLRDTPVLFQVDGCQSVGQLPINVDDLGCDILSFTGRKFVRGPRATGMVWANDAALAQMSNPAGVDMAGASWDDSLTINPLPTARRFEPYEVFYAGKVGLAVALRYAANIGIENIAARNRELSTALRSQLSEIPGVTVHDKGVEKAAIVTFKVAGHPPSDVRDAIRAKAINVSTTSEGSARLDFPERGLIELVRASVHYYNTEDEVDRFVAAIANLQG